MNLRAGVTRAAWFALALLVAVVASGAAEIATVADIEQRAVEFRERGGSTLVYRLKEGINASACDRLTSIAGVSAAGGVRRRGAGETASTLPDQVIPTFEVSAGFGNFRALGGARARDGVLISEDVSATLGVVAGGSVPREDGPLRIGGVFRYPADGRLPGYGYSILIPADSVDAYDECWVEAWPPTDALTAVLPGVLIPGASTAASSGQGPQLKQLNASLGTRFDGADAFEKRITRFAPAAVALFGFASACYSTLRRRLELAAARHAGVTAAAQALQLALESLAWASGAAVIALPVFAVVVVIEQAGSPWPLSMLALRSVFASIPAVVLGATAGVLCIRERQLFTYFKAR